LGLEAAVGLEDFRDELPLLPVWRIGFEPL
jgi:hypothetical protein